MKMLKSEHFICIVIAQLELENTRMNENKNEIIFIKNV